MIGANEIKKLFDDNFQIKEWDGGCSLTLPIFKCTSDEQYIGMDLLFSDSGFTLTDCGDTWLYLKERGLLDGNHNADYFQKVAKFFALNIGDCHELFFQFSDVKSMRYYVGYLMQAIVMIECNACLDNGANLV